MISSRTRTPLSSAVIPRVRVVVVEKQRAEEGLFGKDVFVVRISPTSFV